MQLEDWAPQHLAERELPGRETRREGGRALYYTTH